MGKYKVDDVTPRVLCARLVGDGLSMNIRSRKAGGERRQVLNRNDVVAGTEPGMDVVDPSRSGMISLNIPATPSSTSTFIGGKSARGAVRRESSGNQLC